MGFRINTNMDSIVGIKNLLHTNSRLSDNLGRLSSGLRINRAADDAAGLGVSEGLKAEIRGMNQAVRNGNDGVSIIQTAEGALNEIQSNLARLRELAVQSSSGTLHDSERSYINTEADSLIAEINRLADVTTFNGQTLLNGGISTGIGTVSLDVQVGIFNNSDNRISVSISSARTEALGINLVTLDTSGNAQSALSSIDTAIDRISSIRAGLGAVQNRLGAALSNLQNSVENLSAAESRIRDLDFATESAEMSRNQILQQAGISVLSQANTNPQAVMNLLK